MLAGVGMDERSALMGAGAAAGVDEEGEQMRVVGGHDEEEADFR